MSEAPSDGGSQGEDNGLDDYENGSEAGGAGDSSGRGKAKVVWQRYRISKACDQCKQRRRKCDGQTPACGRCVVRGIPGTCTYTPSGKKRGPARQNPYPTTPAPIVMSPQQRYPLDPVPPEIQVVMVKEKRAVPRKRQKGVPDQKARSAAQKKPRVKPKSDKEMDFPDPEPVQPKTANRRQQMSQQHLQEQHQQRMPPQGQQLHQGPYHTSPSESGRSASQPQQQQQQQQPWQPSPVNSRFQSSGYGPYQTYDGPRGGVAPGYDSGPGYPGPSGRGQNSGYTVAQQQQAAAYDPGQAAYDANRMGYPGHMSNYSGSPPGFERTLFSPFPGPAGEYGYRGSPVPQQQTAFYQQPPASQYGNPINNFPNVANQGAGPFPGNPGYGPVDSRYAAQSGLGSNKFGGGPRPWYDYGTQQGYGDPGTARMPSPHQQQQQTAFDYYGNQPGMPSAPSSFQQGNQMTGNQDFRGQTATSQANWASTSGPQAQPSFAADELLRLQQQDQYARLRSGLSGPGFSGPAMSAPGSNSAALTSLQQQTLPLGIHDSSDGDVAKSTSMSISALLAGPFEGTGSAKSGSDQANEDGSSLQALVKVGGTNNIKLIDLLSLNQQQGEQLSFWDDSLSVNSITPDLEFLLSARPGLQPVISIPVAPGPRVQPGMFDDLPPVPSEDVIATILELFFQHVNPSMNYVIHLPSFFNHSGGNGELLLLFAMLAAAAPGMAPVTPGSSLPSGQSISLAFFRRAQRLLQPLLASLISARRPTVPQLCAILIMSAHAATGFSSSQLGYQLGVYVAMLLRTWGCFGERVADSREREILWATAEETHDPALLALIPPTVFPTVLERETLRRVVWYAFVMDKTGSTATPFLGRFGSVPLIPNSAVNGLLLPCENQVWIRESSPILIASSLTSGAGIEIGLDSVASLPDLADKTGTWWQLRLHSILSRIVEYHMFCTTKSIDPQQSPDVVAPARQRIHAMLEEYNALVPLRFRTNTSENPVPHAEDVWTEITYHMCYVSLHTPRQGAGLDPTVLLQNAAWLMSSDFAIAAEHSARVAEQLDMLDLLDPLRSRVDNAKEIPMAQISGTIAFVRMVVAQRAYSRLLGMDGASPLMRDRLLASIELAKQNMQTVRRQQTIVGRRCRMAAQMALYLRTMEESSAQFGAILDKATKSEAINDESDVPVIWTEQGLILNYQKSKQVMVGWDDVVGVPEQDEWSLTKPKDKDKDGETAFTPATASTPSSGVEGISKPEWRWRLAGGAELEKKLKASSDASSSGSPQGSQGASVSPDPKPGPFVQRGQSR